MTPPRYSPDPRDASAFTRRFDRAYSATAGLYDFAVRHFPVWSRWLGHAIPPVRGPRVLDLSCGTGHLLARLAAITKANGVDLNRRMLDTTRRSLSRAGVEADLVQANVEHLPYADGTFDSIVNTMAFSGYPDGTRALGEMKRVLRPGGRLIVIDIAYPLDGNRVGRWLVGLWKAGGDLVRDMDPLFREAGLVHTDEEIGGWGSVHLYIASHGDAKADAVSPGSSRPAAVATHSDDA